MAQGSEMISSTVMRGLRDVVGSWKTIWIWRCNTVRSASVGCSMSQFR
jgi:hypothetical protein